MPTYNYKCPQCEREVEVFKKITDTDTPICVKCDVKMDQIIVNGSFQLKGSNWFKNDGKY